MATGDIKVRKSHYGVQRFRTEANIKLNGGDGDCVIIAGTGTNYVDLLTDGMPTRGTDEWVGVTHSGNTATSTADGVCDVELVGPGSILEGRATTAANINTDAKLLGILNDTTNFDRTASTAVGVLTIDETNTTAKKSSTLSLYILDGDIVKGTLRVAFAGGGMFMSNI